uniref:Uncharacterized protein n=1 Tax=viral metagenome TaxID=1070528 RepID=A0A6C0EBM8_9ZZZZ
MDKIQIENIHITVFIDNIYDLLQSVKNETYDKTKLYDEINLKMTAFLSKECLPWVTKMYDNTNYKECFDICNNIFTKMKEINEITSYEYAFCIDVLHLTNYFRVRCMDNLEECIDSLKNQYINIVTLSNMIDKLLIEKKITIYDVLRIIGKHDKYSIYILEKHDVFDIDPMVIDKPKMLLYLLKKYLSKDLISAKRYVVSPIIINDVLSKQNNHVDTLYIMHNILDIFDGCREFYVGKREEYIRAKYEKNDFMNYDLCGSLVVLDKKHNKFRESYEFFTTIIVILNDIFNRCVT